MHFSSPMLPHVSHNSWFFRLFFSTPRMFVSLINRWVTHCSAVGTHFSMSSTYFVMHTADLRNLRFLDVAVVNFLRDHRLLHLHAFVNLWLVFEWAVQLSNRGILRIVFASRKYNLRYIRCPSHFSTCPLLLWVTQVRLCSLLLSVSIVWQMRAQLFTMEEHSEDRMTAGTSPIWLLLITPNYHRPLWSVRQRRYQLWLSGNYPLVRYHFLIFPTISIYTVVDCFLKSVDQISCPATTFITLNIADFFYALWICFFYCGVFSVNCLVVRMSSEVSAVWCLRNR